MEHIQQFDWYSNQPDIYFVNENGIDNCVTERILRNKFRDPMVSSDSEDDTKRPIINWKDIFKQKNNWIQKTKRIFVPGLRAVPHYLKLSTLTTAQHMQCLKVICSKNPNILSEEFFPRPTIRDHTAFEELKEKYETEQKEYIEWAKTMWTTSHCERALRPKLDIETIYEAEFKLKAHEMDCYPKQYEMAAQIPMEDTTHRKFEMVFVKDVVSVDVSHLPEIVCPSLTERFSIMEPRLLPEPCQKHPCKFVLPNQKQMSMLPVTEVHRELAEFAIDNGCQYIASERALRCLAENRRLWTIPISVCRVFDSNGEYRNVIVLGSDMSVHRDCAPVRMYKAFKRLLEFALIPARNTEIIKKEVDTDSVDIDISNLFNQEDDLMTSDEDEDNLHIDMSDVSDNETTRKKSSNCKKVAIKVYEPAPKRRKAKVAVENGNKSNEYYVCNCDESFVPPPRSFTKWTVRNVTENHTYNMIVHSSRKARFKSEEVILEPIPEYQIELGACKQSEDTIRSLALSLFLRRQASLVNVRIDTQSGEVVTIDKTSGREFLRENSDIVPQLSNTVYTVLDQLQGLMPGHYVLQHQPNHGPNALLYATKLRGSNQKFNMKFDSTLLAEVDEAKSVKTPPVLTATLLPYHKLRKILPCAFTPIQQQVAKEIKKPVTRQKAPPQAMKTKGGTQTEVPPDGKRPPSSRTSAKRGADAVGT